MKEVGTAHMAPNIAKWIPSIMEEYELKPEQIVACVTDDGANKVAAMEILKKEHDWKPYRCAAQ